MKHYYLQAFTEAKYGWLFVEDNDGILVTTELRSKTTDNYLRFPQNDYGQKMICMKKLIGLDRYDLEPYSGRHDNSNGSKEPKTDLLEALALCLNEEERATFLGLCEKAKARFKIFKQKEALKKQIELAQAKLAELE